MVVIGRVETVITTVKLVANFSDMVKLQGVGHESPQVHQLDSLPEGSREPGRSAQPQLHIDNRTAIAQPQPHRRTHSHNRTARYG